MPDLSANPAADGDTGADRHAFLVAEDMPRLSGKVVFALTALSIILWTVVVEMLHYMLVLAVNID